MQAPKGGDPMQAKNEQEILSKERENKYAERANETFKNSIIKIKESKRLKKNLKILDFINCSLVTVSICCSLYVVRIGRLKI